MATIKEMTYRLWRRLEGSNIPDDSKWTYAELKGYIVSGITEGLKRSYYEQRNLEDFRYGDGNIAISTKQTVLTDTDSGLPYINITNKSISVAGNRFTSISSLNPISAFSKIYAPIRREEVLLVKLQPCVPNTVYFYIDSNKAFFFGDEEPESEVRLTSKYAIPTDDTVEMSFPTEFENNVLEIAFRLLLAPQVLSDRENNGVPNT